ncbi:MAG: pyridoxal-phosphate dependent enzyme [Acidobacteria bacterium]|nr:pyridoxal-phosphate dependent enzyme [Acidobacteriota bacterium]
MNFHENVLHLIGHTPLVRLGRMAQGIKATVLAKMESLNPGYSVKDRIGVSMVEAAEREGTLKPGGTIVEATSGNTGIGLALAAAVKGYRCIFVMTEKASVEKVRYLKALGADVVVVPATAKPGTQDHYVETARRIARETPNSFYPDQYSNPNNPEAHYRTTGPELWEQTEGRITHFVAGLGTGGTISGTGRFLKEQNPDVRVVGADPYGSVFKTYKETGRTHEATPYLVEGIGQEVVPANVHIRYVDEIINVTDRESFELSRQLGRKEGIFCGGSTGTNLAAALKVAKGLDESGVVVFIVCDTGEHYLTKHHSDEWLKEKRLLEPRKMTAGLISSTKPAGDRPRVLSVAPTETVAGALAQMDKHGVTQMPVIEEGKSVGSVRENRLLAKVLGDRDLLGATVSQLMEAGFPVIDVDAGSAEVTRQLRRHPAVLVEEFGRITGIITRHDMLDVPNNGR